MNVKLGPYPAYRESGTSWLNRIPTEWDLIPGLSAFKERPTGNAGSEKSTVLSLSYGRVVVKPREKLHGLVPSSFNGYQIVHPGNIVIRPTDLQNDKTSLRVGIANERGIITSAYLCLETIRGMSPSYGFLLLHAYDLMKVFYGMGSGLRQNLSYGDLRRMPVLLPPPEEQQAISNFLAHFDQRIHRLIRTKRRQIELLHEQKQAIIHRAVTRGLDPGVPLKSSGIDWLGDVPAHWEAWQIGHIAEVGNGSTPSRSNSQFWAGGSYPWLNSGAVHQGTIDRSDQFVTTTALDECHLPKVKRGSVLVAITGQGKTRGTTALLDIEATINQHIAYITLKTSRTYPRYIYAFLTAAYRQLRKLSADSGSTKGALTCESLKHFKVLLPRLDEQDPILTQVHEKVSPLADEVNRFGKQIEVALEYRIRLISDVVTGKIDIRYHPWSANPMPKTEAMDLQPAEDPELLEELAHAD